MNKDIYNQDYIDYGKGNKVHNTAIIGENVKMGSNNVVMPFAVIGQMGFMRGAKSNDGEVVIGDNNVIGCHAVIMTGMDGNTVIGNDNMIMNYCNIGHNVKIGNDNEIGAKTIICGHTTIGDHNKIKVSCAIRNRLNIGSYNVVGMGSNVMNDICDNTAVFGNPATVVDGVHSSL